MRAADALGVARLLAAAALPAAMMAAYGAAPAVFPAALFAVAATTDFFDGIVARRTGGPTAHGAILDNVADVAFVLAGTGTAAVLGLVPPAAPLAIALSVAAYVVASRRRSRAVAAVTLARSRVGHAAGVLNYALVGLVTIALAVPGRWMPLLRAASVIVVAVNLAAVLARVPLRPARRSAHGPPGAGTPAR